MTLTLELPRDLEAKLAAGAQGQGIPVEQYALRILGHAAVPESPPATGAEIVEFWRREGVIGSRPDIVDSQGHARHLRHTAERRKFD